MKAKTIVGITARAALIIVLGLSLAAVGLEPSGKQWFVIGCALAVAEYLGSLFGGGK